MLKVQVFSSADLFAAPRPSYPPPRLLICIGETCTIDETPAPSSIAPATPQPSPIGVEPVAMPIDLFPQIPNELVPVPNGLIPVNLPQAP